MFEYSKKHLKTSLCFIGVLFFDQIIKNVLLSRQIVHKNYHSLFGFESNLILATIFLVILIAILIKKKQKRFLLPSVLLLAGTTSNMLDKIRFGFIIDYIDFFGVFVFNIADLAIALGTIIVLDQIIRE